MKLESDGELETKNKKFNKKKYRESNNKEHKPRTRKNDREEKV